MTENQRLALLKVRSLFLDYKSVKATALELELSPCTISRYLRRKQRPSKYLAYWILMRKEEEALKNG